MNSVSAYLFVLGIKIYIENKTLREGVGGRRTRECYTP